MNQTIENEIINIFGQTHHINSYRDYMYFIPFDSLGLGIERLIYNDYIYRIIIDDSPYVEIHVEKNNIEKKLIFIWDKNRAFENYMNTEHCRLRYKNKRA